MKDFTIYTFAEKLGVTDPTVWRMIKDGQLTAYKVRRSVRIPHTEYERLVSEKQITY